MARNLSALVIGNASYQNFAPLQNPINGADDMSSQLTALGFSVSTLKDATTEQVEQATKLQLCSMRVAVWNSTR